MSHDINQLPPEEQLPHDTLPDVESEAENEKLPTQMWVTLGIFAVFVIAFGTCASTFLFR